MGGRKITWIIQGAVVQNNSMSCIKNAKIFKKPFFHPFLTDKNNVTDKKQSKTKKEPIFKFFQKMTFISLLPKTFLYHG